MSVDQKKIKRRIEEEKSNFRIAIFFVFLILLSCVALFFLPTTEQETKCYDTVGREIIGLKCLEKKHELVPLGITLAFAVVFLFCFAYFLNRSYTYG